MSELQTFHPRAKKVQEGTSYLSSRVGKNTQPLAGWDGGMVTASWLWDMTTTSAPGTDSPLLTPGPGLWDGGAGCHSATSLEALQ